MDTTWSWPVDILDVIPLRVANPPGARGTAYRESLVLTNSASANCLAAAAGFSPEPNSHCLMLHSCRWRHISETDL